MLQLIYHSTCKVGRIDAPLQVLRSILKVSAANNAAVGMTGFLIFDGNTFVQVLEGEEETVKATFDRISRDDRHRDVAVIETRPIAERDFPAWAMSGRLREGPHAAMYHRHGIDGRDFSECSGAQIVALAKELAAA